ncbi:hypothetical protein S40288_11283 [Stachybotrys chartarum IBT 40288]|nr:hypothetical protein S40288_11283 [Stachybotrys chartarum IBT 40288]
MTINDVQGLLLVADEVHPGLPERDVVFAERVNLFPGGCMVLVDSQSNKVCGYAISHPIRHSQPPALDSLLGEIGSDADQYYIHDVAILPGLRGRGLAADVIGKLIAVAEAGHYATTCLVSVYGTSPFWRRFGFEPVPVDKALSEKLRDYGDDATYLLRENGL